MWTVFLVEDEEYVREAIRELVDWGSLGFRVAGEAGNGEEALEAIRELKPDVVLADIVMPGLDGIELLRETRRAGIGSRFIMLTAMSDFDYAREALQYGAFNYLLKLSLNDDILLENLSRIKRDLIQELRGKGAALQIWFQCVWADMWELDPPVLPNPGELEAALALFGRFRLTLVAVLGGPRVVTAEEVLEEPHEFEVIHTFYDSGATTFFCWGFKRGRGAIIKKNIGAEAAVRVAASGLSTLASDWRRVLDDLNRLWYGHPVSLSAEDSGDGVRALKELESKLVRCFEEGQELRCKTVLSSLWKMMEELALPFMEVKLLAHRIVLTFAMLAGEKADGSLVADAVAHGELLRRLIQHTAELHCRLADAKTGQTDHPEVNRVIQHLWEHYRDNIRVADLAKLVSMNVDYLSTVFGKKTGMTPIAYLQNIRVEQAKQLLLRSRLSVGEVASETGFTDDAYFIRLFKRITGQTPSAFRRMNGL